MLINVQKRLIPKYLHLSQSLSLINHTHAHAHILPSLIIFSITPIHTHPFSLIHHPPLPPSLTTSAPADLNGCEPELEAWEARSSNTTATTPPMTSPLNKRPRRNCSILIFNMLLSPPLHYCEPVREEK